MQAGRFLSRRALQGFTRARRYVSPVCSAVKAEGETMKVKVALCQFKVTPTKEENLQTAKEAIKGIVSRCTSCTISDIAIGWAENHFAFSHKRQEAAAGGASLVVLPEIWNSAYQTSEFPKNAEDVDGGASKCATFMSQAAKQHGITLVGGSIPELSGNQVYNTCLVYDKAGKLLAKHRKVHLFDIDIPGKQTFKESDTLAPGDSLTVVDTDCGRLGIGICYDIRFPHMAALYARRGVQLLVYPGAFNTTTGPAHWELLQRARAVDNQLFVATCSPANNPDASYSAHGHSMVVSPWGEILATAETGPKIVFADIDYSESETRRTNMPLQNQQRDDLYELLDKRSD